MTILLALVTCWLCLRFNERVQLLRPGSDGKPICTQGPITPDELNAACAERARRILIEGLPYAQPDQVAVLCEGLAPLE